jgi:hypothetical protein
MAWRRNQWSLFVGNRRPGDPDRDLGTGIGARFAEDPVHVPPRPPGAKSPACRRPRRCTQAVDRVREGGFVTHLARVCAALPQQGDRARDVAHECRDVSVDPQHFRAIRTGFCDDRRRAVEPMPPLSEDAATRPVEPPARAYASGTAYSVVESPPRMAARLVRQAKSTSRFAIESGGTPQPSHRSSTEPG